MLRDYESMVLVTPDLDPEGAKGVIEEIRELVGSAGGEVVRVEEWGLRDLAYPIRKKTRAYYFVLYFRAPGDFVREYERALELKEPVLRYLTIRLEKGIPEPQGEETCSTSTG
ncbi:MAG: 30S ribosomal protein S6 [Deltaproteobacteria bacterium]|nr:MAG: 30S ribosomal protein S6 [Deltaproteobacteria bacterium]